MLTPIKSMPRCGTPRTRNLIMLLKTWSATLSSVGSQQSFRCLKTGLQRRRGLQSWRELPQRNKRWLHVIFITSPTATQTAKTTPSTGFIIALCWGFQAIPNNRRSLSTDLEVNWQSLDAYFTEKYLLFVMFVFDLEVTQWLSRTLEVFCTCSGRRWRRTSSLVCLSSESYPQRRAEVKFRPFPCKTKTQLAQLLRWSANTLNVSVVNSPLTWEILNTLSRSLSELFFRITHETSFSERGTIPVSSN